jgi:hypothetical protein
MQHGGNRTGAGRPRGSKAGHTLEAQALRQYIITQFIKNKEPIVQALIERAKNGDIPAIKELFERAMGKVTEKLEVTERVTLAQLVHRLENPENDY